MTYNVSKSTIEAIADQAGLDSTEALRTDYSGRGMYGDACVGITGNIGDLVSFVATAVREAELDETNDDLREFVRHIEDVSTDSMGYDLIFYWRNIQIAE